MSTNIRNHASSLSKVDILFKLFLECYKMFKNWRKWLQMILF